MKGKSKNSQMYNGLWLLKVQHHDTLQVFTLLAQGDVYTSKSHAERFLFDGWQIIDQMPVKRVDACFAVIPPSAYANLKICLI